MKNGPKSVRNMYGARVQMNRPNVSFGGNLTYRYTRNSYLVRAIYGKYQALYWAFRLICAHFVYTLCFTFASFTQQRRKKCEEKK